MESGGVHRGLAAAVIAGLMMATVLVTAPPALAQEVPPEGIYEMTFPVQGNNYYSDTFGACRGYNCSRSHQGTDIMTYGVKGVPVVAVASGFIGWMHNELGGRCCALALYHDDGWASWYIHLNNDTIDENGNYTDDGQGWGFAPGIGPGVHVVEGQVIGYVGDSGNAEGTAPHLHFELHSPELGVINPYDSLVWAEQNPRPIEVEGYEVLESGGRTFETTGFADGSAGEIELDATLDGDFNGDGRTDVATFREENRTWLVSIAGDGAFTTGLWGWVHYETGDLTEVRVGDFNGDGRDDLASYEPVTGRWYVHRSVGTEFAAPEVWADFTSTSGWVTHEVGDFNGDGRDDIANYHEQSGRWYVSRSTGSSFSTTRWADFYTNDGWSVQLPGDFNGDGRDDIANFHRRTARWYVSLSTGSRFSTRLWTTFDSGTDWAKHLIGDFDGNGADDVAAFRESDGNWWIGVSRGSSFDTTVWADFYSSVGWEMQEVHDFNGDGRDDISNYHPGTGRWYISRSTGTAFSTSRWFEVEPENRTTGWEIGDFTGDGRTDVMSLAPTIVTYTPGG